MFVLPGRGRGWWPRRYDGGRDRADRVTGVDYVGRGCKGSRDDPLLSDDSLDCSPL